MNCLLTPLTDAIVQHRGTIDKYMGDAVMAFWNAPLDDAEHPANACRAALNMIERLKLLNAEREAEAKQLGEPHLPMRIGIGVNTGTCVVGNMGSTLRFNYSVLGDSVNFTSRIEGQTKNYGVSIIAGANTVAKVGNGFAALELDRITVKGKTEPEVIYAILGGADVAGAEAFQKTSALNRQMLDAYRGQEWSKAQEALAALEAYAETFGLREFLDLYAERIAAFIESPPPEDWNGVFTAEEK